MTDNSTACGGPAGEGGFGRFFLPGPTEVRPAVLAAQKRALIGHRGEPINALMREIQPGLREVFGTARPVLVSTSSATGLMEAAVRNGARERVLSLVNGAFSERFARIARACGFEVDHLEVPWGGVHDPDALRDRLRERRYDAVTMVHSETSTGALNPIAELARVAREFPDTLVLVDAVTSAGGAPVQADDRGLDFVLSGSQKAMALPPGLAFGVASERMMERSGSAARKGVYFDLVVFYDALAKEQTPNTPAVTLLYSLAEQLRHISAESLEGRWARHAAMARRCAEWADATREDAGVELSVLAPEGFRSPTVTCLLLPPGRTGPEVAQAMKERGFVIGAGYGRLKPRSVRIGHMGDHTVEELDGVLKALEEVLRASPGQGFAGGKR
ncbi:MAG: alanine--glyoxylate aminotransferase family protein [Gammaproteobacteria bacterium]|nr:alanine--glyoxylate aminotransferase family protein [Gammaproteobacteria bacterium]